MTTVENDAARERAKQVLAEAYMVDAEPCPERSARIAEDRAARLAEEREAALAPPVEKQVTKQRERAAPATHVSRETFDAVIAALVEETTAAIKNERLAWERRLAEAERRLDAMEATTRV